MRLGFVETTSLGGIEKGSLRPLLLLAPLCLRSISIHIFTYKRKTMSTTHVMQLSCGMKPPNALNKSTKLPSGYAFINLSEPGDGKHEAIRKLVRSNAMRDFRAKQKQQARSLQKQDCASPAHSLPVRARQPTEQQLKDGKRLESTEHTPDTSRSRRCERSGCKACESCLRTQQCEPSLKDGLGDATIDPFNTYPVAGSARYKSYLLNHCEPWLNKRCFSSAIPTLGLADLDSYYSRLCHGTRLPAK